MESPRPISVLAKSLLLALCATLAWLLMIRSPVPVEPTPTLVGRWMLAHCGPEQLVAVSRAGLLGEGLPIRQVLPGEMTESDNAARALLELDPDFIVLALRRGTPEDPESLDLVEPDTEADRQIASHPLFFTVYFRPREPELDAAPLEQLAAEIGAAAVIADGAAGTLTAVFSRALELQERDPLEVLRALRRGGPGAFCPVCVDRRHPGNYHGPMR